MNSSAISAALEAISTSPLNSFAAIDHEGAQAAAAICDLVARRGGALGALHGFTVGVKDVIDVAGLPSTMGSAQYLENTASSDSAVVSRLRAAGAIIVGKTNTHEFAYGSSGDVSAFGSVHNPHNFERMSGGSSSGSACAVGAGLCRLALGTDTSASIRLPAALCGVVGLKPTFNLIPLEGVFPLSKTLDHVGPLTMNVADNARALGALADNGTDYGARIGRSLEGVRVGVPQKFYGEFLSSAVRTAIADARKALTFAGARVVDVDIPDIQHIYEAQQLILKAEAYAIHQQALHAGALFSSEVRQRLLAGADVALADYLRALNSRGAARASFDQTLRGTDILLTPTCGIVAPRIGDRFTRLDGSEHPIFWMLTRLTSPTNFSGHPSLSVPFGAEDSLPIGMQLIGRHHEEALLYQVAASLEIAR